MVAARRLRKSMLKEIPNININSIDSISNVKHKQINNKSEDIYIKDKLGTFNDDKVNKKIFKFKYIIKIFIAILIVFMCLLIKLFLKEEAMSNKYIGILINEYNNDYEKNNCIEKTEDIINNVYSKVKYILPEDLSIKIRDKYIYLIKPYLIKFEIKKVFIILFTSKQEIIKPNNSIENMGIGGGEPLDVSIQTMEILSKEELDMKDKVELVLSKNIDIQQPVKGTITSKYGTREKIFEELSEYHTGIDIANKKGTPIYSATNGLVVKAEKKNKYYGNNIEIETEGIIFKYAHLESLNVKENDLVTQESVIGYMGSTGMSTGPHLHFEIKVDGKNIDPNQFIKFY